jgi:adenylate cyclase
VSLIFALGVITWQQRALVEADRALDGFQRERTEWPRLVVAPFENLSSEPRLDRLAVSMTEELMIALGQRDLLVVATRTSWYGHGGDAGGATAIAAGGYVFTGSVRGGPELARVTVRLIEAEGGVQIWSAAYDESYGSEAFAELPARVARDMALVAAPYGPLYDAELARTHRVQEVPALRECFARYYDYRRHIGAAAHREALRCFRSVAERKPQSVHARAGLAMLYLDEYGFRFTRDPAQSLAAARVATAEALAIDRDNYRANLALMWLQFFDGDPELRETTERTLALRPDRAEVLANAGALLVIAGDSAAGLPLLDRANARASRPPRNYQLAMAIAHLRAGRTEEALSAAQAIDTPDWIAPHLIAAAAAGLGGHHDVARAAAQRILELDPGFEAEVKNDLNRWRYDRAYRERLIDGLRAAGLRIAE